MFAKTGEGGQCQLESETPRSRTKRLGSVIKINPKNPEIGFKSQKEWKIYQWFCWVVEGLGVTSSNTLSLADPSTPNWYLPPFSPFLFSLSNFPLKLTQRNMKSGLFWGHLDVTWKYNYSLFPPPPTLIWLRFHYHILECSFNWRGKTKAPVGWW